MMDPYHLFYTTMQAAHARFQQDGDTDLLVRTLHEALDRHGAPYHVVYSEGMVPGTPEWYAGLTSFWPDPPETR